MNLKLSNIFNEPNKTIKISDYGIQDLADKMSLHIK